MTALQCDDMIEFKDALQKMRVLDDRIIYTLNNSIPTDSFKGQVDASKTCFTIYNQLTSNYARREEAIKQCITVSADKVKELRAKRDENQDNPLVNKKLRNAQNQLRLLQGELGIEEIVQERTNKIYYERCRPFYKPPAMTL